MMPSPEQQRRLRIEELVKEFDSKATPLIDSIYKRVLEKYPFLSPRITMEYTQAVFRILKAKEKEKK